MITAQMCIRKFGDPAINEANFMAFHQPGLQHMIPALPKRVYCHELLVLPLIKALNNVIQRNLCREIKTWDGCFNIRKKRGGTTSSLHSWGLAIDINAAWNGFGKTPTMSKELVKCFTDAGFEWGGTWKKPDGMHFQLAQL